MAMIKSLVLLSSCVLLAACVQNNANNANRRTTSNYVLPFGDAGAGISAEELAKRYPAPVNRNLKEVRIGILLPLTGEHAELGSALLDAAMLALFDKYATMKPEDAKVQVVLVPKDTGGTAEGAAKAAKAALADGAQLLLGPLLTQEVAAVAPIARKQHINVLSFSNNRDVAQDGVYLFGFLPSEQVERVSKEAWARGVQKMGALLPKDAYGQKIAAALRNLAAKQGKNIAGIEFYESGSKEMDLPLQRLTGGRGGDKIDALLLAENGENLHHMIARINAFGIDTKKVRLLGTGLWDDPALFASDDVAGGWFASSPQHASIRFETRYKSQYNKTSSPFGGFSV